MSRKQPSRAVKINKAEKYASLSLGAISTAFFIAVTAVFPLYISRFGYAFIIKQKAEMFVAITAVAGIATLLALFLTTSRFRLVNYFAPNEPDRPIAVHEWAFFIFLLLTLASAIFSPWQDFVWRGFTTNGLSGRWEGFWVYMCYFITFVIVSRLYRPKQWHFLVFAGSCILLCLYGIIQYFKIDVLHSSGFIVVSTDLIPFINMFLTTLGNVNVVSGYCALVIPLFAVLYAGEDSKRGFVYLFSSIISFLLLCIADGDAGKVGVLGGMVLLIPYWVSDRRRLGRILITLSGWSAAYAGYHGSMAIIKRKYEINDHPTSQYFIEMFTPGNWMFFIVIAVLLIAAGLGLHMLKKWPGRLMKVSGMVILALALAGGLLFVEIEGRRREGQTDNIIWQAREMLRGRPGDDFGSGRGLVWKYGMSVVWDNPFLGTGPDTFYFALGGRQIEPDQPNEHNPLPNIVDPGGLQLEAMHKVGTAFDKAHNIFLQIAVCMGIPALLAFLTFLGGLFFQSGKKSFNRPVLLAFTAASLSYIIQSFFQVDMPVDRPLLYVVLGVMAGEIWRDSLNSGEKVKHA